MNGHEVCGFYHGSDATAVMHSKSAKWALQQVKRGAICEVVDQADDTPEVFSKKAKAPLVAPVMTPETAHIIQVTVQLASSLAVPLDNVHSGAFKLAFRSIVQHAAGHVCGAKSNEICPSNSIVVTSYQGASVSFTLTVANGKIATQAVANMKSTMEDGSFVATQLAAAGVIDVDAFKKMVFGDVQVESTEEVPEEPKKSYSDLMALRMERVARMLRCPKMWGIVIFVSFIFAGLVCVCKKMSNPSVRLSEEPVGAVVVAPTAYVVVKDETSKEQV